MKLWLQHKQLKLEKKQQHLLKKRLFFLKKDYLNLNYFYFASNRIFIKVINGQVMKVKKSVKSYNITFQIALTYNRFKYKQVYFLTSPFILIIKKAFFIF